MAILLLIFFGSVIGFIPGTLTLLVFAFLRAADGAYRRAAAFVSLGCLVASSPWIVWACLSLCADAQARAERVPAPLRIERTEYSVEQDWGIGMPGDNATGFVVYRLADDSTPWSLHRESTPSTPGGDGWMATPLRDRTSPGDVPSQWCPEEPDGKTPKCGTASTKAYLDHYGFGIPVDPKRLRDADAILDNPGGFYRYVGGGVAVMDRDRRRVYYVYAD